MELAPEPSGSSEPPEHHFPVTRLAGVAAFCMFCELPAVNSILWLKTTLPTCGFRHSRTQMSGKPDAIEVEAGEVDMMERADSKSPGMSLPGTIATLSNVLVGGSSVLLPYAFQLSGWCFGPLVLAVGSLMGFTLWIMGFLLESLDERAEQMGIPRSQRDWGLIGYAAFGNVGRVAFAGCMFVDLIGSALFLLSVAIEQLPFLLPLKHELVAVLCCLVAFGCCLIPKRFFSAMAALGIASQVILVVGILATGTELSFTTGAASDQLLFKAAGIPPAVGIALLCFLAHSEAPLIYQMMADRTKWTKAVIYSMSVAETFLLLFGGLGYVFFGGSVGQSIAVNIGRDLDLQLLPGSWHICLGAITIVGLSTKQLMTLPLVLDATGDLFGEMLQWKGRILMKAIVLAISGVTAVLLKDGVAFIGDLVGILPANAVCLIFPCAAMLQIRGHEMCLWQRLGVRVVAVVSTLYSVLGSAYIILQQVGAL
ncbi:AVT1A [Symbiodinium sp. CCMP2592]|nr:AVT1A [Symbiodinium sp. CCMP2592]